MRYCTLADLLLAIPQATLIQLTADSNAPLSLQSAPSAQTVNEAVVAEAVRQAEELVEAHLRGRYSLPLASVPSVVKDITINLARHWLYARRPEGKELPDAVTRTYKEGIKLLEALRDGKISIGLPSGEAAPEAGEVRVRSQPRHFDANLMGRYR